LVPEGIEGRVPYRGTLAEMVTQLVGGLRSGMGYTGCRTIQRISGEDPVSAGDRRGLRESHVHDVVITKEAPNISIGIRLRQDETKLAGFRNTNELS